MSFDADDDEDEFELDDDSIADSRALFALINTGRLIERLMHENTALKHQLRLEKAQNKRWTDLAAQYDPDGPLKCILAGMEMADRAREAERRSADAERADKKE